MTWWCRQSLTTHRVNLPSHAGFLVQIERSTAWAFEVHSSRFRESPDSSVWSAWHISTRILTLSSFSSCTWFAWHISTSLVDSLKIWKSRIQMGEWKWQLCFIAHKESKFVPNGGANNRFMNNNTRNFVFVQKLCGSNSCQYFNKSQLWIYSNSFPTIPSFLRYQIDTGFAIGYQNLWWSTQILQSLRMQKTRRWAKSQNRQRSRSSLTEPTPRLRATTVRVKNGVARGRKSLLDGNMMHRTYQDSESYCNHRW